MTFSAKDLVSRSCSQIKLFMDYPEKRPQPSGDMLYGEKFQKAVAGTIPNIIGEEMRGKYINPTLGITINFSNDIVCDDKIIEVKSVKGKYEAWYLQSSILQCAFYKSMILLGARHLETASFYVNLGNERIQTDIDASRGIRYILVFGEEKYEIYVNDPYKIVGFFENKAIASTDWTYAKKWDEMYKHHEYEILSQCVKYNSIF